MNGNTDIISSEKYTQSPALSCKSNPLNAEFIYLFLKCQSYESNKCIFQETEPALMIEGTVRFALMPNTIFLVHQHL